MGVVEDIENGIETAYLDKLVYRRLLKSHDITPRKRSYKNDFLALANITGRKPLIKVYGSRLHNFYILTYKSHVFLCGNAMVGMGTGHYIFDSNCKIVYEHTRHQTADYTKAMFEEIIKAKV